MLFTASDSVSRVDIEGDDILEADDAAHTWLESMGLDKKQFPSLDPKKVKLYPDHFDNTNCWTTFLLVS
jgi:hypothetical protein